ncbi:site-specific DNA-methyltransferase [Pseudomonas aeruginosa]|uniref:site-specific DNA-methyltransferase n=1 Tax=Pseudomonas aeruginosa TaxID=287 RepID=UPI0021E2DA89|nr:site-specific DNA-methyltransferase [Pseudomonas aeruginosa]MCV0147032.1 site-specific DNA-methyltransferase [Pseudomonas aeruginosa]
MKTDDLFAGQTQQNEKNPAGPVTCLGMTFENDEARRAHFTEELRKKLQDPEFRKIEGFPIGSDENILNLSDPPHYTACPNPWIADFIAEWEAQKPDQPEGYHYHREPFAADVSEGKNDPIYNAHSYHTKVPPKAIARYIAHYTGPGDIIFDGFSGTGMTSVATQIVNKAEDRPHYVSRKCITNDLAPIGSFITRGLLSQRPADELVREATRLINEVEREYGWIYDTQHSGTDSKGTIDYVVWTDFFLCTECAEEIDAYDTVVDRENSLLKKEFHCPVCGAFLQRSALPRKMEMKIDVVSGNAVSQPKQAPKLIQYKINGKAYKKSPSKDDVEVIRKAEDLLRNSNIPTLSMSHTWRHVKDGNHLKGYTHTHHLYTNRNLLALSALRDACMCSKYKQEMLFILTGFVDGHANKRNRYLIDRHHPEGTTCGPLSNSLFVPELQCEVNIFLKWKQTLRKQAKAWGHGLKSDACMQAGSSTKLIIEDESIDYIFVDPPFGKNIIYSDLNLVYESWLGVSTAVDNEAIVNEHTNKSVFDYGLLMEKCFSEFYRILKPGRWITLEFHNSLNSVWNAMQEALFKAGFVVADVRALDKKHGTIHQDSGYTVKQDLIVTAYKADKGLEERFKLEAGTVNGVWDFVRNHLGNLPTFVEQEGKSAFITERKEYLLYDRMVAFHVQRGVTVPMSASEFYTGLDQRFAKRDGMFFLPHQAAEYDKKRMTVQGVEQLMLFISDEASARQWLREQVLQKPQTFQELHPQFMKEIGGWSKTEKPLELSTLLEQNFLRYDGKGPVPEQIHAYLSTNWKELRNLSKVDPTLVAKARDRWYVPDPNKAGDLEKLREKALLKEFEEYKEVKKKLKVFRLEAVRAGFKKAWQERDYGVIVAVADKIPNSVLEEDPKLLMWYDQAVTRMGGE